MQWEYLSVKFNYKGLGIKEEFTLLDIDGERVSGYWSHDEEAPENLPKLLDLLGADGWELVTHAFSSVSGMQHMHFKRPRDASAEPQVPL